MYISKVTISNFRNFKHEVVEFTSGLNVFIGHNNSGKTNLINAIQLIFDRHLKGKPLTDDFNKEYSNFSQPPRIDITATITEYNDQSEDKNVVYDWLIKDSPTYEAQLTYSFFLPNGKHMEEYLIDTEQLKNGSGTYKIEECFKLIEKKYIKKYISRVYGGFAEREERADTDNLDKFDFHFLDAIRDAEQQMFYGNNTLLRDVLNYFLDHDLTEGKDFSEIGEEEQKCLIERDNEFKTKSRNLMNHLIDRIDKNKILEYSKETGAKKGGKPDFDAEVVEQDLLFALRLIIEKNGFKIPLKYNGLGYNNLLFISLILSKMQMECSSFMGDNAKIYPILAIEEPEAHLHPSMQYKFLKFLNDNLHKAKQARQIFITTHSTHITSAVDLDSIVCLYEDPSGNQRVGYPGKVFNDTAEDKASKVFIRRFLDATKSNMLFADRVIFVEGLAEQILLPCVAAYIDSDGDYKNKEEELLSKHVSIISVDSRTFKHFIKLFSFIDSETTPFAINKRVSCITDADPVKKDGSKWKACYPFELKDGADFKGISTHITQLINNIHENDIANINIFHPEDGKGKTFEYEIAISNIDNKLLLTSCFPAQNSPHTIDKFQQLQAQYTDDPENTDAIIDKYEGDKIKEEIVICDWASEDKSKAFIAAIYYEIAKTSKGEHSFYLEKNLRDNLEELESRIVFNVPVYIKEAINFVTE